MGLETGTYISDLNAVNPVGASDPKSQGDDHIRLIKSTILASFPGITGAMTKTHTELNNAPDLTAANTFTDDRGVVISSAAPALGIIETGITADNGFWSMGANAEQFILQLENDARSVQTSIIEVDRTTTVVDKIALLATTVAMTGADVDMDNTKAVFFKTAAAARDNCGIYRTAADALTIFYENSDLIFDTSDQSQVAFRDGGTDIVRLSHTGTTLSVRQGYTLKIFDAADADHMALRHNGTNILWTHANTANIHVQDLTGAFKIQDGAALYVEDASGADRIGLSHDGTDALITGLNSTHLRIQNMDLHTESATLVTDNDSADEPGFKGVPHNQQNGSYTLVLTDAGKKIYKASGGGGETITIPANSAVAFPVGTIVIIDNQGGGNLSIAITTDTLKEYGTGSTGTRTLATVGKAILEKQTSTVWGISGIGLS